MEEPITADRRETALPPTPGNLCAPGASAARPVQEYAIALFDNIVAPRAEAELISLYQNAFSCLAKFRIDADGATLNSAVLNRNGKVSAVFVFRRERGQIAVLNQAIRVDEVELRCFCQAAFLAYPDLSVISFHGIETSGAALPYPSQRYNCLENIVLALPPTADLYHASLGRNMRASIKRYGKKLAAELPALRFDIYLDGAASAADIRELVCLSNARMAAKQQRPVHGDEQTARLVRLVQAGGLLLVASIDNRICAGVVCSRVGRNYFMHVVAHDPAYDELRLGKLSCYRAICECITRGGKEFHFLWGRYEYKYRLLGVQRELDHLAVFRSRAHMFLHADVVIRNAVKGYGRLGKRWLFDPARQGTPVGSIAGLLRRVSLQQ
jgi:hypothetical protein